MTIETDDDAREAESMLTKVDGELRNAVYVPVRVGYGDDYRMFEGELYHDRKGRFSDGFRIHTGAVMSQEIEPDTGALIVHTKNSVYRVFMRGTHVLVRHEKGCITDGICFVCDGGLSVCEVCGGVEAELTKECLGRLLTKPEKACVMRGDFNFVDGDWVERS